MHTILTKCPLFQGLGGATIENILKDKEFSTADYSSGQLIAPRDTAYSGLMIILRGEVRGEVTDKKGRRSLVDRIAAPQLIAPAFLFGGYNRLPMDIVAETDVTILTLHRGLLFELMQDNIIILSNFIDIISDRANMLTRKIFYLSFRTVKEKVANYLLEQTKSQPDKKVDFTELNRLSEYFDAPRSAITTVLNELERKNVVRNTAGQVEITDRAALEKI